MSELVEFAEKVVQRCTKSGADNAEVYLRQGLETEIQVRHQEIETLQEGSPKSIGLRVWKGDRTASTYGTDFSDRAVERLIADSLELAKLTDPIPELALPASELLVDEIPNLELFDAEARSFEPAKKLALIRTAEQAALDHDERITVSQGAAYGDLVMEHALANSAGFANGYKESYVSYHVTVVADDDGGKKRRGFWFSLGRHLDQLLDAEEVGRIAAERTLAKLGAGPIKTGKYPIVFDPMAGASLLGLLFSVIRGRAIEQRSSYLIDRIGEQIGSEHLTVIDDPTILRGPGSKPYDGEGLPAERTVFVDKGVLQGYALNNYSARKLGMKPTGHASRPSSGSPGETSSNLFLAAGSMSREDIIADVEYGLYCDSMMGFGFNAVTGDFSRGASGFLIEDGKLTRPVSEVTVSSNFNDIFGRLDAVADDLEHNRSVVAPTFRVAEMTVAGQS